MVFDPVYNLVSHLQMPSSLDKSIQARQLALRVVEALDSPGILQDVSLEDGRLVVNETAPRTTQDMPQSNP